jgi:protein gp37
MSIQSTIEWTDATWNPVRGCTKVSPGCAHCYAEVFAERFRGVRGHAYEQGFDLRMVPEKLLEPIRWATPKMVFVNSMSDLFHSDIPDVYVQAVARVMCESPWHTYQVLTKRSERLNAMVASTLADAAPKPNIWWGVSVEDRKYGLPRIADLQTASVGVRFLSIEPLLEDLGEIDLSGIHWVIVGGESGVGARAMYPEWVLSLLHQCEEAHVPFFFKQWGGVRKGRAGRTLNNRFYNGFPPITRAEIPSLSARKQLCAQLQAQFAPITARPRPDR